MSKLKKLFVFFIFSAFLIFLLGSFVFAQKELEVEYPTIPGVETPITTKTALPQYAKYIFNFSIITVGFIALGILIYGGIRYLTSAGNPAIQKEAKSIIFSTILGLIILLSSYLILTTINPQLIVLNLPALEKISQPPTPSPISVTDMSLTAQEVPVGTIIEYRVLEKNRLEKILELSVKIWETSDEIQKTSKEIDDTGKQLANLVGQCTCNNCTSNCGGCPACPCNCSGDPCSKVRDEIKKSQAKLKELALKLPSLKVKLEKLLTEIQPYKEELKKELPKLEKVEELTKSCFNLMSYAILTDVKESGDRQVIIEKLCEDFNEVGAICNKYFEPYKDQATFYCEKL